MAGRRGSVKVTKRGRGHPSGSSHEWGPPSNEGGGNLEEGSRKEGALLRSGGGSLPANNMLRGGRPCRIQNIIELRHYHGHHSIWTVHVVLA